MLFRSIQFEGCARVTDADKIESAGNIPFPACGQVGSGGFDHAAAFGGRHARLGRSKAPLAAQTDFDKNQFVPVPADKIQFIRTAAPIAGEYPHPGLFQPIRGGILSVDPGQTEGAKAIGMNVIAFDIFHIPGIEEELGIPYVEMDELLAKSDFISVHAPAVDGGALINAERIAKMKDGVVIINTSRGTNVDEAALLDALNSGKVRAAGLDVYADEPATNVALYSHPMVSCTPHIGSATVEAQGRIGEELVEIISKM